MLIPKLDKVFCYILNGKYSIKDIKRFIKHIIINKETGCWEWTGRLGKNGYGIFRITKNRKQISIGAHRVAIEMTTGILIPDGQCVCHHCDNPRCVNVLVCLFLGTHQDNSDDKISKGRGAFGKRITENRQMVPSIGENNGRAKLTWTKINNIRNDHATGKYTYKQLANKYNISESNICHIINNKTWRKNKCH